MNKKYRSKYFCIALIFLVVSVLVIGICDVAEARAGGGGYYRSSGGSSRSGGGDAEIIVFIIRLLFDLLRLWLLYWRHSPIMGTILTVIIVVIVLNMIKRFNEEAENEVIGKGASYIPNAARIDALNNLKKADRNFNEDLFKRRLTKAFVKIQNGWAKRDLTGSEAFLSDGTYEQFTVQIQDNIRRHIIDYMEGLQVKDINFENFTFFGNFQTLDVSITASAINYRIDDRTNAYLEGSRSEEEFTEVWTLVRRIGSKSQNKTGLMEGNCPNCGNPISSGRLSKCEYCGSLLRSGEHDWVLTKITQACEWRTQSPASNAAVLAYSKFDKEFNLQHIEDMTTVMFWRLMISMRTGDVSTIRKMADDEFCNSLGISPSSPNPCFIQTGVGSLTLLAVGNAGDHDIALVKILWGGIPASIDPKSQREKITGSYVSKNEVFVLKRRSNVLTKAENAMNSAHCPNCGAPETDSSSNACQYCGTVLNSGEQDWVLTAVYPTNSAEISRLRSTIELKTAQKAERVRHEAAYTRHSNNASSKMHTSKFSGQNSLSGKNLISWSIAMMLADGVVDENETKYLLNLAKKYSMNQQTLKSLYQEISRQPNAVDYMMRTTDIDDPLLLIKCLYRMAMADGKISNEELDMIDKVANAYNISKLDCKQAMTKARSEMYRESIAAIKTTILKH